MGVNLPCSKDIFLQSHGKFLTKHELRELGRFKQIFYYKNYPFCGSIYKWFGRINKAQHIYYRFEVVDFLGEGSYGKVFAAFDHKEKSEVAIKAMVVNVSLEETLREYRILKYLKKRDAEKNVVKVKKHFLFRGIYFMVLEKHPGTLLDVIRLRNSRWSTIKDTQICDNDLTSTYGHSLLENMLRLKQLGILHTDIKPENLLVAINGMSTIKLADFGLSCFYREFETRVIRQTLCYKAPEILLGGKASAAVDMWSTACVLAELYTGNHLFNGGNNEELIASMMELMGMPPQTFLKTCDPNLISMHITSRGYPIYCKRTYNSFGSIKLEAKPLLKLNRVPPGKRTLAQKIGKNDPILLDFFQKCFVWRPEKRITVEEALLHPYFQLHHITITGTIISSDVEMTSDKSSCQSGVSPKCVKETP